VPGVGEKTAAALITAYGDLDGVLRAAEAGDPGVRATLRAKVLAARDYLAVAPTVVRVAFDVPVALDDDRLPTAPADPDRLAMLTERWGLTTSVARLSAALAR
jgi:5'-3' exonuclease